MSKAIKMTSKATPTTIPIINAMSSSSLSIVPKKYDAISLWHAMQERHLKIQSQL